MLKLEHQEGREPHTLSGIILASAGSSLGVRSRLESMRLCWLPGTGSEQGRAGAAPATAPRPASTCAASLVPRYRYRNTSMLKPLLGVALKKSPWTAHFPRSKAHASCMPSRLSHGVMSQYVGIWCCSHCGPQLHR